MAQDYYCILTNAGLAYEAACKANQVPIKLTHFAVGDGNGAAYNPGPEATALRRETHRQPINSLLQDEANPSWLLAEAMIADDVGGWTIREVGIFTDTGLLYAIGKYPDSVKPVLAQGSGKQFYVRAIFQTSNATSVTLLIDNSIVMATRAFVLEHVQAELAKLDSKQSVRVATTANIALTGLQTVDGVVLAAGDRVLVKNQAAAKDNGIYIAAQGVWPRAADADINAEVTPGLVMHIEQGATLAVGD
ncbi:phage tail protein [Pseudomonas anguilliseptica]|uniref:phage tail protein n=1 Tax=Pseudomonas anguilliseptica TaxID=53406 RepID=UPI003D35826D